MKNDLPPSLKDTHAEHDSAHDAYNAAFYELGLRWHWDRETYAALVRHSSDPHARIRHYIETHQPHLLSAYDPAFLAAAIHERVLRYIDTAKREGARLIYGGGPPADARLESGLFGMLAASQDTHEGLTAFLEKRPPKFQRQ